MLRSTHSEHWREAVVAIAAIAAGLCACNGFREAPLPGDDGPSSRDTSAPLGDGSVPAPDGGPGADSQLDGAVDVSASGCPPALATPTIGAFTVTDGIDELVLGQEVSLVVQAAGDPRAVLSYRFDVDPAGDAVVSQGDGSARWALTSAPTNFFSTEFTITATVGYACEGGPSASAKVALTVLGNILVGDRKHGAIEAVGSGGQPLGQLMGPAQLTTPDSLLLLDGGELAVGDGGAKLVKIVDLAQKTVVRSIGSGVSQLEPRYLARAANGDLLVAPVDKNKIARFTLGGTLVDTITAPHSYGVAGLAVRGDGKIVAGVSGSGKQYAFSAAGVSEGLFANPPEAYDTNVLLALPNNELLLGTRNGLNDGKLVRIDASGAAVASMPATPKFGDPTYYAIVPFRDGYLFLDFWDADIFRLGADLALATQPFATLPGADVWPTGIVWLHPAP